MNSTTFLNQNFRFLVTGGFHQRAAHLPKAGHRTPEDFAGVCVASSPDPACDSYILGRLEEVGLRHVRLDYSDSGARCHTDRFLGRLLEERVHVLLHLVQPRDDARAMPSTEAEGRWRRFVETTLDRWGDRIEAVEIGSTVNRRKWSGYTPAGFMAAWRVAHSESRKRGVRLAGPNVTDFEPLHNIALLGRMRAERVSPDIHTNNLFVERALEPERFDHKVAGRALAPVFKFNLVKKADLMRRVARRFGQEETWSTHVAWSKRRVRRLSDDFEERQANYLARYFLLAAAAGALSRTYWGPLIDQRAGLIDDGTDEYPDPPHVTLYELARGSVDDYKPRPALDALKAFIELIPGSLYEGRLTSAFGLEAHSFQTSRGRLHALWTVDGRAADPAVLYAPKELRSAQWLDRDGARLPQAPTAIRESPCYALWPEDRSIEADRRARPAPCLVTHGPIVLHEADGWRGAVAAACHEDHRRLLEALDPSIIERVDRLATLRKGRNTVWRIDHPFRSGESLVVKRAAPKKWSRRILDSWKPSKARRSWNGACELARRGVDVASPVAFFERSRLAVQRPSYYVCEHCPGGLSVRSFFSAYAAGARDHEGLAPTQFYQALAPFLLKMHARGVHFRDLSAGNILVRLAHDGRPRFLLIDTARARFFRRSVNMRRRLSDLKRICHPLHWSGREEFVGLYLSAIDEAFTPLRRMPFHLYDFKHRFKGLYKKKRRRSESPVRSSSPAEASAG